ncbi:MAG: fumarylacetoacetate hydrolase family protein [Candidatus Cyclobacteriaceae bacterium M3_2C_046]
MRYRVFLVGLLLVLIQSNLKAQKLKIARFKAEGNVHYGVINQDMIDVITFGHLQDLFQNFKKTGQRYRISQVDLLPPVEPTKIIAFGWTFSAHAREVEGEIEPKDPLVFLKPPSSLIGHLDTIEYPEGLSDQVEFEAELAIIIGKKGKNIAEEEVYQYILGYSCFNDVSARDLIREDPQFTRGKGFDTFGPIGPWLVNEVDPMQLTIKCYLNGDLKQNGNTNQMVYSIPFLISYISQVMTLMPGDVILSGTPGGTVPVYPGDEIMVEIEKVGTLVNYVE